ncbi:MAG: sigma-70 family RNA polymerase sigma factor [Anaerolineae bacterium]|nr:sigma-70 family RNA polymerase sigma factor [Anaerolineae bacterium]
MKVEQALLERAEQYDRAALGELYDYYAPRIYAYVYRRVGNACLAEDLTGDVFVRVIHAIRSQRTWHTSFQAWLYRIAHNLVADHYRQQPAQPLVSLDEALQVSRESGPAEAAEQTLSREQLRTAVGLLTQEQQEVLALRFGEGLTARKTAAVLQKTTGAVDALQHRALATLRRLLTRQGPDTRKTPR